LGGSHATGPHLTDWLTAIAAEAGSIAIVPGGGPFADAVRAAQASMGFDDPAAHAMALDGDGAVGCAPRAQPPLRLAASRSHILRALKDAVPVWSPGSHARRAAGNPGPDLTAFPLRGSLARLAQPLLLVKHGHFEGSDRCSRSRSHGASILCFRAISTGAALRLGWPRQPTAQDSPKGCGEQYFLKS
jgi:hypothetical protein